MKDKEAKRFAVEKAQIEALIEKHRPCTLKTPDEVSTSGTGKKSCKKGEKAKNAERGNPDTLLGDPVTNTATGTDKAKEKGQKDKIGIDDIGIY